MKGSFWYSTELNSAVLGLRDAKIALLQANETEDEDKKKRAKQLFSEALKRLREVQQNDRQYRDEMLDKLAEKRGETMAANYQKCAKVNQSGRAYERNIPTNHNNSERYKKRRNTTIDDTYSK